LQGPLGQPEEDEYRSCSYILIDRTGDLTIDPIEVSFVNSIADCDQACCFYEECTGYAFENPKAVDELGSCYLYGVADWWDQITPYPEGDDAVPRRELVYRKKAVEGYVAKESDCSPDSSCLLNTEAAVFPIPFGETCDDNPFFTQKEFVMELDKCVLGYGYSNMISCIGPGRIIWTRYNSYDDECTGDILTREVILHPDRSPDECYRGRRSLHYTFTWGGACQVDDFLEDLDVSDLLNEFDEASGDDTEEDEDRFEEFVKCESMQSVNACYATSFCDWDWFSLECVQYNLLVETLDERSEGSIVNEGCVDQCVVDSYRCQNLNDDGTEPAGRPMESLQPFDLAGIAGCILRTASDGWGTEDCTNCIRDGVAQGQFEFRCNYYKKKDCLAREWEECVWRAKKCSYRLTSVDERGSASLGRCSKKDGRRTQCQKLEGCSYVESDGGCVPTATLDDGTLEGGDAGEGGGRAECGNPVKAINIVNAARTRSVRTPDACECQVFCVEDLTWRFKVADSECTCFSPREDLTVFVDELKPTRKSSQAKYVVPVTVTRPCIVDCPWMLSASG